MSNDNGREDVWGFLLFMFVGALMGYIVSYFMGFHPGIAIAIGAVGGFFFASLFASGTI